MNKIDDKQSNNAALEEITNKLSELEGWLKAMESRVSILEYNAQKLDKKWIGILWCHSSLSSLMRSMSWK